MFMADQDGVQVHENAKEPDQYPTILTEQVWSIKDLLDGKEYCFLAGHSV